LRRRQTAGALSGGEQKIPAIGCAVIGRPRLLLDN
jgi:ABC-type branched-subunit amino acid transport system ATPase component